MKCVYNTTTFFHNQNMKRIYPGPSLNKYMAELPCAPWVYANDDFYEK